MRTFCALTLAAVSFSSPTLAQPGDSPKPTTTKPVSGGVAAVTLSEEAFHLDAVGLTVRFPIGCQVNSSRVGGEQTVQILPPESTWFIKIRTPRSSKTTSTIPEALDETLKLWQGSTAITDPDQKHFFDETAQAKLIERIDELTLPGGPAGRVYISNPIGKSKVVNGYTIFKPGANQFVTFEFNCHEVDFNKLRGIYEMVVSTAAFENSDAIMLARGAAIKAGTAFFTSLAEHDYLDAMGTKETWTRLYKPAKNGMKMDDAEIGYRGLKFWRGKRGEINPSKPKSSWRKGDEQDGYLCQERTRVLRDKSIVDAVSISFMTPDRMEEAWMIVTTVKDGDGRETGHASETGARNKSGMTILKTEAKRPPATISPPIPPEGYLSKFESVLLPRLLVNRKAQLDTGFYWWGDYIGSDGGAISFHKCSLETKGALQVLTTSAREATQAQTSIYNPKGELVRTELSNGEYVWEPVKLEDLKHLWEQKGLPVDR